MILSSERSNFHKFPRLVILIQNSYLMAIKNNICTKLKFLFFLKKKLKLKLKKNQYEILFILKIHMKRRINAKLRLEGSLPTRSSCIPSFLPCVCFFYLMVFLIDKIAFYDSLVRFIISCFSLSPNNLYADSG